MKISIISIITLLILIVGSNLGSNIISLTVGAGYFIPEKSSIFTFKYTLYNSGSGEYWLYGEDSNNFYEHTSSKELVFPKAKVRECLGFNPLNYESWCAQYLIK